MRHLWKQFRWRFLSWQRLSFPWLFMSQQGLCGLMNPSSPMKAVSGAILELATTQFSLTVSESTGAVWANESIHHVWKQFRGLFLIRQRLSFSWLFLSQQGVCALTNPCITSASSLEGYFWAVTDLVLLDCFWVNRGCVCWGIHVSPLKTVSGAISKLVATQFSLTISESTGVVCAEESMHHLCKQFRGLFKSGQRLIFPWLFLSHHGLCALKRPHVTCGSGFSDDFWVDNY
jgi:hypothetical protein